MSTERYALSFTSGGLLLREAQIATSVYVKSKDWKSTRVALMEGNLLQVRTATSGQRLSREVVQRLSTLSDAEIEYFTDASLTEQQQIMWVAACRRYEIIAEFAEEVLRERFLLMQLTISHEDFDQFVLGKALWHSELDEAKPSTMKKLKQNLFRMMAEADLITLDLSIIPVVLTPAVSDLLSRLDPTFSRLFPTSIFPEVSL